MGDLLRETLRSLRAHGGRFGLTALGIAWGALMLTFLSAQMTGFADHFVHELEEVGPKIIYMGPGVVLKNRVGERGSRQVELDKDDVARVRSLSSVEHASPLIELWSEVVRHGRHIRLLNLQGLGADAESIRNLRVSEGRFLSPLDVARAERVAVVGARARERLFGARPALGAFIEIGSQRFRVIGVLKAKGDQLMNSGNPDDLLIVIPYTTAQRWMQRDDRVPEILISPRQRERGALAIQGARDVISLHQEFGSDAGTALWANDMWDILKVLFGMFWALRLFLVVAGGVTLFVGAVGVMNIMLVVVGERTPEIGLRKAVGARGRDIFLQFLAEAVVVSTTAGVLGSAAGAGLMELMKPVFVRAGISMPAGIDPFTATAVTGSLVVVAVVAGVVPALRAARVPPAEALRAL